MTFYSYIFAITKTLLLFVATPFDVLARKLPFAPPMQVLIGFMAMFVTLTCVRSRKAGWMLLGFLIAGNLWALLVGFH